MVRPWIRLCMPWEIEMLAPYLVALQVNTYQSALTPQPILRSFGSDENMPPDASP